MMPISTSSACWSNISSSWLPTRFSHTSKASMYLPFLPLLIQIRSMLSMVAHNRAIYDILVLLLSYPEKRASLLDNVIQMNVDEDSSSTTPSDSEFKESYNVGYGSKCWVVDFAFCASQTHRVVVPSALNSFNDHRDYVEKQPSTHH